MNEDHAKPWGQNPPPANFPPPSASGLNFGAPKINQPMAPPPPPPEITLRTMKSDLESLKQSGGIGSTPKPFTPPELTKETPRPTPPAPPSKIIPSDFSAPKTTAATPVNRPATPIIIEEGVLTAKSNLGKILMIVMGLILAIGAGVASYLYVFPILFPNQPPAEPITQPTSILKTPAVPVAPAISVPAITHKSLLKLSNPALIIQMTVGDLNEIKTSLSQEAQKLLIPGSLTEILLEDSAGQLPASALIPILLPDLTPDIVSGLFDEDLTIALYHDNNGHWPVYLLKLNSKADLADAKTEITKLEFSADLVNLFLTNPEIPVATFQSGQANGVITRYLTYSQKGAGLNIGWINNTLIISTSYIGFKEAINNLAK